MPTIRSSNLGGEMIEINGSWYSWENHRTESISKSHVWLLGKWTDREKPRIYICRFWVLALYIYNIYPPTPAFAKAGAAPGTTAGVELVFLSFKCLNASSSFDQPAVCLHSPLLLGRCTPNPARKSATATSMASWQSSKLPQGYINGFFWVVQPAVRQALHASNPSNA